MFERLLNMFINKEDLDKREKANLADDLEPARPGEVDPSILKTIQEPVEDAEHKDNLLVGPKEADEVHDEESKKEEKQDDMAELMRDEIFKKFKRKS